METFVETDRFTGACYKAANWKYVGTTKGRGKLGPANVQSVPIKDILLYPLDRDFRKILTTCWSSSNVYEFKDYFVGGVSDVYYTT